jgi:hypothetical protein
VNEISPIKFCIKCKLLIIPLLRSDTLWCKECKKIGHNGRAILRRKEWGIRNKEYRRIYDKKRKLKTKERDNLNRRKRYHNNNKINNNIRAQKRRASLLNAHPSWANNEKIALVYQECFIKKEETGVEYVVDHIIPLQNKYVCGLHVHNNLRIITLEQNSVKHNWFFPEDFGWDNNINLLNLIRKKRLGFL